MLYFKFFTFDSVSVCKQLSSTCFGIIWGFGDKIDGGFEIIKDSFVSSGPGSSVSIVTDYGIELESG